MLQVSTDSASNLKPYLSYLVVFFGAGVPSPEIWAACTLWNPRKAKQGPKPT